MYSEVKTLKVEDNKDLSSWLEEVLRFIYDESCVSVAIACTTEEGPILTSYYRCSSADKALYASYINQDSMLDTLEANPRKLKEIISSCDDESDEDEIPDSRFEDLDDLIT